MPKATGMQLLLQLWNSPGALAFGDARTSDNDSPRRIGLCIEQSGGLSNGQRNKSQPRRLEQLQKSELARDGAQELVSNYEFKRLSVTDAFRC